MNRDQWAVFHALNSGYSAVSLLADFASGREHIVSSQHGRSGIDLPSGVYSSLLNTTGKGLIAGGFGEPPIVTVTWQEIRAWVDSQPTSVIDQAKAMRSEWGSICRARFQHDEGYMPLGPTWAEKTVYGPKTRRATTAIDCDLRERVLRNAERDLVASLAPSNEPTDLLELLEAIA